MTHTELIWQGITAIVTILTIVAAYLKQRQQREVQHTETTQKIDKVQTIVNGQSERQQARIAQLEQALVEHGADVPQPPTHGV